MKKTKLFSFQRFCYVFLIAFAISYAFTRYYEPKESPVQLDEWGEPVIQYDNLDTRDDALGTGGGTSYTSLTSDGDYSAIKVDSVGALWTSTDDNALRVAIVNDDFGSSWSRLRTTEQGYLQCENIDKERWALIPKEELDKFKAYKSQQFR